MIDLDGDALRRARSRSRSPSPTARWSAAAQLADALRRRGDHAERAARAPARVRHRRDAARRARCRSSARDCSSAWSRRAGTRRSSSSISRCRATSSPRPRELDDVFLYSVDDLVGHRQGQPADPHGSGRRRPRQMIATQAGQFPALARRPHGRADDHRAARAITTRCAPPSSSARGSCSPAARRPSRRSELLARGLTNKFLHAPTQALNAGGRRRARGAGRDVRARSTSSRRQSLAHRPSLRQACSAALRFASLRAPMYGANRRDAVAGSACHR